MYVNPIVNTIGKSDNYSIIRSGNSFLGVSLTTSSLDIHINFSSSTGDLVRELLIPTENYIKSLDKVIEVLEVIVNKTKALYIVNIPNIDIYFALSIKGIRVLSMDLIEIKEREDFQEEQGKGSYNFIIAKKNL